MKDYTVTQYDEQYRVISGIYRQAEMFKSLAILKKDLKKMAKPQRAAYYSILAGLREN